MSMSAFQSAHYFHVMHRCEYRCNNNSAEVEHLYHNERPLTVASDVLQIYEIPFFVALDHKREAILVAVRGTLSLKVCFVLLFVLFTMFNVLSLTL